jgi:hypothetical protein
MKLILLFKFILTVCLNIQQFFIFLSELLNLLS